MAVTISPLRTATTDTEQTFTGDKTFTGSVNLPIFALTLAGLKAQNTPPNGSRVYLAGTLAQGDYGEGLLKYDATADDYADDVTVIAPNSNVGRYFRVEFLEHGIINAQWYGMTGGTKKRTDFAMNNGSMALSAPIGTFTSADVGKYVCLDMFGAGGTGIVAQIASILSTDVAVLDTECAYTASGVYGYYGFDDTAGFNAARDAAELLDANLYIPPHKRYLGWFDTDGIDVVVQAKNAHFHHLGVKGIPGQEYLVRMAPSGWEKTWQALTDYSEDGIGDRVLGTTVMLDGNRHYHVCIQSGTSGATEPVWSEGVEATTEDGTVIWQELGYSPGATHGAIWQGGNLWANPAGTKALFLGSCQFEGRAEFQDLIGGDGVISSGKRWADYGANFLGYAYAGFQQNVFEARYIENCRIWGIFGDGWDTYRADTTGSALGPLWIRNTMVTRCGDPASQRDTTANFATGENSHQAVDALYGLGGCGGIYISAGEVHFEHSMIMHNDGPMLRVGIHSPRVTFLDCHQEQNNGSLTGAERTYGNNEPQLYIEHYASAVTALNVGPLNNGQTSTLTITVTGAKALGNSVYQHYAHAFIVDANGAPAAITTGWRIENFNVSADNTTTVRVKNVSAGATQTLTGYIIVCVYPNFGTLSWEGQHDPTPGRESQATSIRYYHPNVWKKLEANDPAYDLKWSNGRTYGKVNHYTHDPANKRMHNFYRVGESYPFMILGLDDNGYPIIQFGPGTGDIDSYLRWEAAQTLRISGAIKQPTIDTSLQFSGNGPVMNAGASQVLYVNYSNGSAVSFHAGTSTVCARIDSSGVTLGDSKNLVANTNVGSKIGTGTDQKLGFWNKAPIAQPANANQAALVNSTGGVANGTIDDVGTSFSQAGLNKNFAELFTLLDGIRTVLVNTGLMKGGA